MMRGIEDKEYVICPSMNPEVKYRSYSYRWYVLSVSCFLALSNAAIWISYSTVATHVQMFYCSEKYFKINGSIVAPEVIDRHDSDDFQLADCEVSFWTNQIFQIVGIICGLAGIFITDKYGIKVSIYCGTITNLIGIILRTFSAWPAMSQHWRLMLLYTGQTIAATSQPFFLVLSPKIAEFWFADNQRALANALSFAANPAGVVLGTVAPELIVDRTSMRNDSHLLNLNTLFLGLAVIVMMMAFGVRSGKPPTPPSASSASNISPPLFEGLLKLFRIPIFYVQMATLGMTFALCWGFFMGAEPMMTALDYHFVGYASALAAIAGFISSIIVGYYVDKTKKFKEVIKVGSICIAVVAIGLDIFLRHKNSNWYDSYILGGLMVLLGFFSIPAFPIGLELGIETTYPIAEASSSGVLIIASQLLLFTVIAVLNNVPKLEWFYTARNQKGHENDHGDVIFEQNYQLAVDAWTILAVLSAVFTCTCLWPRYKRLEYEHAAMSEVKDSESAKDTESV